MTYVGISRLAVSAAVFLVVCTANLSVIAQSDGSNERVLISGTRQLTFEGKRAGEGYFSADGSRMVFQSERDSANPFFQIFLLDFQFGDVVPVSPGHGKTTCAWVHPDNSKVLYSSTHDDPEARKKQRDEIEFRESGQTRRYSWDYDLHYELYAWDAKTHQQQRLTDAKGYDAEGSYSPDGKLIAFASNRNGYTQKLTAEQQEKFKLDPAYMMDLFIMNADGTNVRQLTDVPGYDGGPFFSPDGKRICWRRFAENGATAEIMTMNIDGSDERQLTRLGKLSWAPFYHPSGKYLIFTTNRHGFSNFELYLVDAAGKSAPVRVTETAGFDGLASFSPDGKKVTWTSNRNEKKQSQIYLANWNHEKAMELLKLNSNESPAEIAAKTQGTQSATQTSFGFEARDVMRHVDYLCRKELGGRMTGTSGEKQATAYVAAYLDNLGLKPNGDNGSWYQEFTFPAGAELGKENRLISENPFSSATRNWIVDRDWRPLTFSNNGQVASANAVFAGYGISVPKDEDGLSPYDSYAGLDVQGKWVLMLRYLPEEIDDDLRSKLAEHSGLRKKIMVARDQGAIGIIVASGPNSNVKQQLIPLEKDFSNSGSSIAAISITDEVATNLLKRDLKKIQDQLDIGEHVNFPLNHLRLASTISVKPVVGVGRNVVGRLQVSDQPSEQAIVIGAHIDHLGKGGSGSLARNEEKGAIHFGADDNASGVAAMLEIAEFLANLKRDNRLSMKRDIVFAGWSGEELGLYGSKHYAKVVIRPSQDKSEPGSVLGPYNGDPHDLKQLELYFENFIANFDMGNCTSEQLQLLKSNIGDMSVVVKLLSSSAANSGGRNDEIVKSFSNLIAKANQLIEPENAQNGKKNIAAKPNPIVACLNMDMVGRMEKKLVLQGLGSSSEWNRLIEKANVVVGLPIETSDDTQLPTDASSFYQAGVPILSAFTGSHTDYHTPRDTPEKLNYPATANVAKFMGLVARQLVLADSVPDYVKRTEAKQKRVTTGRRARLGTVPNYTEKVTGVLLDDVEEGGPAAIAGLKGGDIIVQLAGKKIDNIYDFQYAIDVLKIGKETGVSIIRDGQRMELTIIPGSRD